MSHGWSYTLTNTYEEHLNQPVYSVAFNSVDSAHSRLFASCGGRRVSSASVPLQQPARFSAYYN